MKILWAKSGGLVPLDTGGKIRSYNIVSELARRHEVTLFTFYPAIEPDPHAALCESFSRVVCLPLDLPERGSVADVMAYVGNAVTTRPYQMRKYCHPDAATRLLELLNDDTQYDVLLCDFMLTAGILPPSVAIPTVVFTHNVEAAIWRRHVEVSRNPVRKLVAWREYETIRRMERNTLSSADHVLTVSDEDRESFLEFLPQRKVTTVPTGVDLGYFRPAKYGPVVNHSIVFTGSMDWLPNEDAICYFASEILPLVQEAIPDVTVQVVGRRPTRKLQALNERNEAIQVTGAVDDVRPYIAAGAVYMVPIRIGGGTRIKIFEAMAMGKPIVSTSVGAEGLPVKHDENLLLADSSQKFAQVLVALLQSPADRDRLGIAARRLVEEKYGWSTVTNVVDQALTRVARAHGVATRSTRIAAS